jgi:cysteinyl-tRNA synthetase
VELLLELRGRARDDRDYQLADRIRDALLAAGVEVHDSPEATTWEVRAQATDGTRR